MCCAEWIQFTPKNRQKENIPWFGTDSDRSERDEVGERDGAERRQRGPELHTRLMTKLSCSRFPLTVTTGDGRSTPAAAGWRSCAAGVPTGRSAASASSAPSSVGEKRKKREQTSSPQLSTSVLGPRLWISVAFDAARWAKNARLLCDGGSWIPDTKTETWLQEISEIKQSAWVITQVRASVTAAIKVTFLAKNVTLGEAGAAARASALKRNDINSETNKVLQWVFQEK